MDLNISEQQAVLVLSLLPGLTQSAAVELYRRKGSALAALTDTSDVPPKALAALRDVAGLRSAMTRAEEEMRFCEEGRISILAMNDAAYPTRLSQCHDAPLRLFYRGSASLNAPHAVAVVGTRRITNYGKRLCEEICADLQRLLPDTLVVSGLAYGVDIHAHRASLEHELNTVGVLAHGLDRIYPAMHRSTAAKMLSQGGLLTEHMSLTIPDKGNFVRRNRIVAGMTAGTIVVESADKGGALITAHLAFDYGREVMAFPGRTTDPYSMGCNKLIRTSVAQLVTCGQDIIDCLGWQSAAAAAPGVAVQQQLFPEFSPDERRIIDALDRNEERNLTHLLHATGIPIGVLTALVLQMEIKGWVKKTRGNSYLLNY